MRLAQRIGVDTLIAKLYAETGLMSLASRNGGKENLTLLYDYARSYEAGSFKGLYNFINFINEIIDKKTSFDDARAVVDTDAVKIITAHSSKGLEYPIVFCVEADNRIYDKEVQSRIAYCDGFGFSFFLRTPSGIALVDNPVQKVIRSRIIEKIYEEELRILYVVLTRAREQLYVVGKCPNKKRNEFFDKLAVMKENMSEYMFRNLNSFLQVILTCDSRSAVDQDEFCNYSAEDKMPTSQVEAVDSERVCDEDLCTELKGRFAFEYPNEALTILPEKMSVSLMSPTILDGSEGETQIGDIYVLDEAVATEEDEGRRTLPSFISGDNSDESAKRGIATHLFMQFCDLENLVSVGADAELKRLRDRVSKLEGQWLRERDLLCFLGH